MRVQPATAWRGRQTDKKTYVDRVYVCCEENHHNCSSSNAPIDQGRQLRPAAAGCSNSGGPCPVITARPPQCLTRSSAGWVGMLPVAGRYASVPRPACARDAHARDWAKGFWHLSCNPRHASTMKANRVALQPAHGAGRICTTGKAAAQRRRLAHQPGEPISVQRHSMVRRRRRGTRGPCMLLALLHRSLRDLGALLPRLRGQYTYALQHLRNPRDCKGIVLLIMEASCCSSWRALAGQVRSRHSLHDAHLGRRPPVAAALCPTCAAAPRFAVASGLSPGALGTPRSPRNCALCGAAAPVRHVLSRSEGQPTATLQHSSFM